MSKGKRSICYLIDNILNAIEKIERFAGNKTFDEFGANEMAMDAVIRNFEIIGEAARNIPDDIKAKNPHAPAKRQGMQRNRFCFWD